MNENTKAIRNAGKVQAGSYKKLPVKWYSDEKGLCRELKWCIINKMLPIVHSEEHERLDRDETIGWLQNQIGAIRARGLKFHRSEEKTISEIPEMQFLLSQEVDVPKAVERTLTGNPVPGWLYGANSGHQWKARR